MAPRAKSDPPSLEITSETEVEEKEVDDLLERTSSVDVHADASSERAEAPNAVATTPIVAVGETARAVANESNVAVAVAEAPPASAKAPVADETPRPSARAPAVPSDQTPHPNELDLPDFRPRKRGRTVVALIGVAAAIAIASVAWVRYASHDEAPTARVPEPAKDRAPEPARPSPEPAPAPVPAPAPTPVAAAPNDTSSDLTPTVDGAVAGSLEKATGAVTVKVKVVPEDAVVFRAGKRLGAGAVEVSVEHNVKQRFTALLDGYTPSNFVLDGSTDSVTIMLKRAPRPRPAPPPESAAPSGDAPSADSTSTAPAGTTAPAATAAPTTESAPTTDAASAKPGE